MGINQTVIVEFARLTSEATFNPSCGCERRAKALKKVIEESIPSLNHLHLLKSMGKGSSKIKPKKHHPIEWFKHYAVLWDGMVYDPCLGTSSCTVNLTSSGAYFSSQFLANPNLFDNLSLSYVVNVFLWIQEFACKITINSFKDLFGNVCTIIVALE